MSRWYEMNVRIVGFDTSKEHDIQDAAGEEWNFDDYNWHTHKPEKGPITMSGGGQSSLCGGESEDEFSKRFIEAVWKANKGYCVVEVNATYLEDLPSEFYTFDEDDYQRFIEEEEQE